MLVALHVERICVVTLTVVTRSRHVVVVEVVTVVEVLVIGSFLSA